MDDVVKQFYEKADGEFGLIAIRKEDKVHVDALVRLLKRLGVHKSIDKEKLLKVWKSYNRDNVRMFGQK